MVPVPLSRDRLYVKICGLSRIESARTALDAGADAIGMVMAQRSRRNVGADVVRELAAFVGSAADTVLVVDALPAADAAAIARDAGVDVVQLHGAYTRGDVATVAAGGIRAWRALSWADYAGEPVGSWGEELLLLDSPVAGSGAQWDPAALGHPMPSGPWLLAGGLAPDNVGAAVRAARPWGVDVSSGVESAPGVKDDARIRAFVAAARSA